jgi:hypothetical protein
MQPEHWSRVRGLPERETARHPFGQRNAVLERASIIQEATGCDWPDADQTAWELEVLGGQRTLLGGAS